MQYAWIVSTKADHLKPVPIMDVLHRIKPAASALSLGTLDKLFQAAKKRTVIQLRWPLVILCSYLLLYAPNSWFTPTQTNAVLIFYLLSNATLYLVADDFLDSPYFYGPLLFFDTVFLAVCLAVSGGATPDFYVACFFTLVLSCVCSDSRGLLVVTLLVPVLYAYVVLNSTMTHDASGYLGLPFPLALAMFYGYFAQIERIKQRAKENEEQAKKQQQAAEELKQQHDRLEFLHEVSVAVTSAVDARDMLDVFLRKALVHLPYAAAMVRLQDHETGLLETAASKGIAATDVETSTNPLGFADEILEARSSFISGNVFTDPRIKNLELFRREGLVSFVGLPLVANGEFLGNVVLLKRQEHDFCEEEIGFLSTLAGQIAIAIHHSQLFGQIQQQANELQQANKVKDEFLGVVSHELKNPLNVISG